MFPHLGLFIRDVDPVCRDEDCDGRAANSERRITSPRYIGLRVKRYGPRVISSRLVGEVGLISVSARRNMTIAQTGRIRGTATSAMPSGGTAKPRMSGQSSHQLIATAKRTQTRAQTGGGILSMGGASVVQLAQLPVARPCQPKYLRLKYRHYAANHNGLGRMSAPSFE